MQFVGKLYREFSTFYNDLNPSTLSGAIDIIVIQTPSGTFHSTPFHVRFGKITLLRTLDKKVQIKVNGQIVEGLEMKVSEGGDAFFEVTGLDLSSSNVSNTTANSSSRSLSDSELQTRPLSAPTIRRHYYKSYHLSSQQLQNLNLQTGCNTIDYIVESDRFQGTASISASIYFWPHDTQIVISDIDGTITKSDALGHLFHIVGKDWTHLGIASLYQNISRNGYQVLYLTSRAIGQSDLTRNYLWHIEQNGYKLPHGPVFMSPDRLMTAFKREVIDRRPEQFKIQCLKEILSLFEERNPFYAGFGNRLTDAISYKAVGIPEERIYSIDSMGELKLDYFYGYKSSYVSLNDLVDQIFPPINKQESIFNEYHFWRDEVGTVEVPTSAPVLEEEYESGEEGDAEFETYEEEASEVGAYPYI